jgi:hypothetical protein
MLLSDAIRKGCESTTKGAGSHSGFRARINETGRACALGAAIVGGAAADDFGDLYDEWPCLRAGIPPHEVPGAWEICYGVLMHRTPDLLEMIYRINDWMPSTTREAIAEWIDDLHARGVIDARHINDLPTEEPAHSSSLAAPVLS